jgi:hypothetical protein
MEGDATVGLAGLSITLAEHTSTNTRPLPIAHQLKDKPERLSISSLTQHFSYFAPRRYAYSFILTSGLSAGSLSVLCLFFYASAAERQEFARCEDPRVISTDSLTH